MKINHLQMKSLFLPKQMIKIKKMDKTKMMIKIKMWIMIKGELGKMKIRIDEDITTSDTTTSSIEVQGPITRSRAQQLCRQVNSFLYSSANDLENRWLPNNLIVIRNQGVDHGEYVGHQEGVEGLRKHIK
jgi:hypothetical protein